MTEQKRLKPIIVTWMSFSVAAAVLLTVAIHVAGPTLRVVLETFAMVMLMGLFAARLTRGL